MPINQYAHLIDSYILLFPDPTIKLRLMSIKLCHFVVRPPKNECYFTKFTKPFGSNNQIIMDVIVVFEQIVFMYRLAMFYVYTKHLPTITFIDL